MFKENIIIIKMQAFRVANSVQPYLGLDLIDPRSSHLPVIADFASFSWLKCAQDMIEETEVFDILQGC